MAQVEMKNVYINIVANNGSEKLLTKKNTTCSNVHNPHTWRP